MNDRSRWIALVVLCTGMLMIVLDMTIVNVALPTIQADLGFSQAGLAWVVNAYLIAFAGLLLLAGRLGDLAGRRDVFLAGLAIFTVASMACGLAVNQEMLIVARFAQGTGGYSDDRGAEAYLAVSPAGGLSVDGAGCRFAPDDVYILRLRQYRHRGSRGVDPPLRFGRGHSLHAVHATFVTQFSKNRFTRDFKNRVLQSAKLGWT